MGVNRRTAALALTLGAALALQGCGDDSAGSGEDAAAGGCEQPLNVLVGSEAQYPEELEEWFGRIQQKFMEQTGGEIRFETFASAADEQTRIQTAIVAGQGPDVYSLGTTFTPVAYATDAFVELGEDEWAAVGGRDRFIPGTLGMSGPSAESEVGVPFVSRPFVMAYNTELFAQAGLEGPPQTWDQLVEYGQALTADGKYGVAIGYADNYDPWKFIWTFASQYGNPLIEGDQARLDDPSVRRALEAYYGFLTEYGIVNPVAVGWSNTEALASFASGESAMMLMTSPTSFPTLEASAVADSYAYAPMPAVPPGESTLPAGGVPAVSIVSGDNMVVADYSQQQECAFEFIELVTSEEEQVHYFEVFGDLPTNAAAAEQIAEANPNLAPILEAADGSYPTPFTGAWSAVQLALTDIVAQSRSGLAAGAVDPAVLDALLEAAQADAQAALEREAAANQ